MDQNDVFFPLKFRIFHRHVIVVSFFDAQSPTTQQMTKG